MRKMGVGLHRKSVNEAASSLYHAQFCKPPCKIRSIGIRWAWSSSPHAAQKGAALCRSPRGSNTRKERCISYISLHSSSLIEINTFWTKWETVKKGVRLLNEVKKRTAFLTEENSSWGRRVVGFEWKPLHVVPTLFMSNCKKTVEWFCCVCINNVRIMPKVNHSYCCHMWSSCERSEQLTHNIIDDFLIIRCTLTGIIMSCYDSRINQTRRDW